MLETLNENLMFVENVDNSIESEFDNITTQIVITK